MNKSSSIILCVMGVILAGFFGWAIWHNQQFNFDIDRIIESTEQSGGIAEHVEGNPNAEVLFIEYSDYQCSGCASVVDDVHELLEKYGDKIGVVHRTYVLSYHTNGVAAATAVEAAGLQGFWKPYGDYLFAHQDDWFYSDATERTKQFEDYFMVVTEGRGDLELFRKDFAGEATKAKVNFDLKIAKQVSDDIQYTPAFFLDGEFINWAYDNKDELSFVDYFSQIIDSKLAK